MCGIFGFSKNLKVKKYDKLLNHRGPDGFDYKTYKNFIISNFRLGIIDSNCKTSFPYAKTPKKQTIQKLQTKAIQKLNIECLNRNWFNLDLITLILYAIGTYQII